MEVNSMLTGQARGLPQLFRFLRRAGRGTGDFQLLFDSVLELGRMGGWRYVEFRGERISLQEPTGQGYAHHVIELANDEN